LPVNSEILCTIQGKDPIEAAENEESMDEEVMPPPTLANLDTIVEELSAPSLCYQMKRGKITQQCLKDGVTARMS